MNALKKGWGFFCFNVAAVSLDFVPGQRVRKSHHGLI